MSENSKPTPDILDQAAGAMRDAPVPPGPPPELAAATVAAINQRLAGAAPGEQLRRKRRRRIMRYVGFGTATAAALAVVTVAGVTWFGGSSAAANVRTALDNAEKAKSVKVTATLENDGKVTHVRTVHRQGDLIRVETTKDPGHGPDTLILGNLKTREALLLNPKAKTAQRTTLGVQEAKLVTGIMEGLSGIKEQVAGGDEKAIKDLGEEKLGGRKTRAYELTGKNPPGVWKVWVDPKTELPVRVRLAGEKDKAAFTLDFEEWNAEFDAKLFELKVPEGYAESKSGPARPPEILFAEALDGVAKATSMRAVITLDAGEGQKLQMKVYHQGDLMRSEAADPGMVVILDGKEKKGLLLFTQKKMAQRLDLDKNDMAKKIATDVAGAMKMLGQLKGEKVAALPDETLDGRKLKVYELKGIKVKELPGETDIKIWIDPKSLLPAHTRVQHQQKGKTITVDLDVLGWNEELDEKLFELKVPKGYTVADEK